MKNDHVSIQSPHQYFSQAEIKLHKKTLNRMITPLHPITNDPVNEYLILVLEYSHTQPEQITEGSFNVCKLYNSRYKLQQCE